MDLETLQSQMKVVIQKHQIVVTEMKKDPQNPVLQKQLRDLNSEIMSLSEKQKQIMQHLRNNLQKKQCPVTTVSGNQFSNPPSTLSEVRMVCTTQKPVMNHCLSSPVHAVTLAPNQVPNFINSLHQPVPPNVNSLVSSAATLTFKAPMGTVVLPNCSNATALLTAKSVDNQKMHPVLVVPTPSTRSADGSQTGVLLNIVPPIRVPQYPPPQISTPMPRQPFCGPPQKFQSASNFVPASVTPGANSLVSASPNEERSSSKSPLPCSEGLKPYCQFEKMPVVKADPKKVEFMSSLGLVSKDHFYDIKSKKNERKRRTTANPQFSNAALEEKLQRAAAAAQFSGPAVKRPRGRPRLDGKPTANPTNGISPHTEASINNVSPVSNASSVDRLSSDTSNNQMPSSPSAIMNGIHRQIASSAEEKKVEELLSGLCIVCTQPGDLVKCDSCAKQQHPSCMQPPLPARPEGKWQCSECQSRAETLTAVHSYEVLKAAKEDEKRKLLKKSLELRLKRSQLEGKLYQLKDVVTKQKERQSELHANLKKTEGCMEFFQNVIRHVQHFS